METNNTKIKVLETKMQDLKEQNTSEHSEIKNELGKLSSKFDEAIASKADKDEVRSVNNRLWNLISTLVVIGIGFVIYIIQKLVETKIIK